ncbi:unknown [Clostridium sp. CAG:762]|nr:unknown [Clostridium sp. CAG:762]
MTLEAFFTTMLYILGSTLLIVLIILGIKLIITMNKIENVVDDINVKVDKLNGLFNIIDYTTDKLAIVSDKMVEGVSYVLKKMFFKKNKKKEEKDYE